MKPKTVFYYRAFGLAIKSEFEMFQLATATPCTTSDLRIVAGSVTKAGIDALHPNNRHCQVNKGDLWLNITDVARFLISKGNKITIDVEPDADLQTVKLYLLGSAFGAILQQRGDLVLHGNAVRIGNQAIIVVAGSGVGKSTLAGEFLRRGYQLLADDVCAIDPMGLVQPSYPYLKLWQSSLDKLDFKANELSRIRLQNEKFYYPINEAFQKSALPVAAIYVLNKSKDIDFSIIKLKGIHKLSALIRNKYRPQYAKKLKITHEHITHIVRMLKNVDVTRIIRPEKSFKLKKLAQLIIDDFEHSQA